MTERIALKISKDRLLFLIIIKSCFLFAIKVNVLKIESVPCVHHLSGKLNREGDRQEEAPGFTWILEERKRQRCSLNSQNDYFEHSLPASARVSSSSTPSHVIFPPDILPSNTNETSKHFFFIKAEILSTFPTFVRSLWFASSSFALFPSGILFFFTKHNRQKIVRLYNIDGTIMRERERELKFSGKKILFPGVLSLVYSKEIPAHHYEWIRTLAFLLLAKSPSTNFLRIKIKNIPLEQDINDGKGLGFIRTFLLSTTLKYMNPVWMYRKYGCLKGGIWNYWKYQTFTERRISNRLPNHPFYYRQHIRCDRYLNEFCYWK